MDITCSSFDMGKPGINRDMYVRLRKDKATSCWATQYIAVPRAYIFINTLRTKRRPYFDIFHLRWYQKQLWRRLIHGFSRYTLFRAHLPKSNKNSTNFALLQSLFTLFIYFSLASHRSPKYISYATAVVTMVRGNQVVRTLINRLLQDLSMYDWRESQLDLGLNSLR